MSFTGPLQLSQQEIFKTSSSKLHALGTMGVTRDGKFFRYAQAGAVDLAAGKLTISPAKVANHTNVAVQAAAAVNDTTVSITAGATAVTANQYDNGYLNVNEAPGIGQNLQISGHSTVSAGGGTVIVQLLDPVTVALTTAASKVSLVQNPWDDTIISSGAVAFFGNGVPVVPVTAAYYYWSQTHGMASVLSDGVITKAAGGIISDAVNGAVEIEVAATVTQRISWAPEATVDAKYYPQFLTIE